MICLCGHPRKVHKQATIIKRIFWECLMPFCDCERFLTDAMKKVAQEAR